MVLSWEKAGDYLSPARLIPGREEQHDRGHRDGETVTISRQRRREIASWRVAVASRGKGIRVVPSNPDARLLGGVVGGRLPLFCREAREEYLMHHLRWALAGVALLFVIVFLAPGSSAPPASKYVELSVDQVKAKSAIVSYELLARSPTTYTGQLVTFRGQVIQVLQNGLDYTLRVNVSRVSRGTYDRWQDTIYVDYRAGSAAEPRILNDDVVQLWGEYVGIASYKAVLGQTVQIPRVVARAVDRSQYFHDSSGQAGLR